MEQNKTMESIRTISKTVASLSEASSKLSLSIRNLTEDETFVERIKPDLGYMQSIAAHLAERAEGVLENTCGREGLNLCGEDEFYAWLSYDSYVKAHADYMHIKKMKAAVDKARADGENMTEWMLKNTNFEDVITGKVKKPWKPEPAGIGKILREWRGDRYSLYAIAKECGCRSEGLQRIEEGKDVTTTNLMHYLHFIKSHDSQSDVIAAIWQVL